MSENIASTLTHLDPATLIVGVNVRLDARLDKRFIASVRERGVLEPVIAYTDDEGQHVVLRGQRRTLAAVQTGRETVPVLLVERPGDVDRIIDQVAENDHRAGLTTGERVTAWEQLSGLGLSAAQIAKRSAASRTDVQAALTVAASPIARDGIETHTLTLEQAAVLAEFEDDEAAVERLTRAAERGGFDHCAQRLRDDRAAKAEAEQFAQNLTGQGLTVVDEPDTHEGRLTWLRDEQGEALTEETHAACPGHAVFVDARWEHDTDEDGHYTRRRVHVAVPVCTDWAANGHTQRPTTGAGHTGARLLADMTEEEAEQARAQRREVRENNKSWDSAETVRREWLATFAARKTAPKDAAAFVAHTISAHAHVLAEGRALTADLLGLDHPSYGAVPGLAERIEAASPARALHLALVQALAGYEHGTGRHSWRTPGGSTSDYLSALARWGYTLSPVEQIAAGLAPEQDDETDAETDDEPVADAA